MYFTDHAKTAERTAPEMNFCVPACPLKTATKLRCSGTGDPEPPGNFDHLDDGTFGDETARLACFGNAVTLLESTLALDDNVVCLKLVEYLSEKVGYRCAGRTKGSHIEDLMLLSASAAVMADKIKKEGL